VEALTRNLPYILGGSLVLLLILLFGGITLLNVLIVICSIFLICLVLIQRGKGGGLAGAFGGMGGSSAFGTKAGDVFTWTTVVTALVWFLIAGRLVMLANHTGLSVQIDAGKAASRTVPVDKGSIPPPTKPGSAAVGGPSAPKTTAPASGSSAGAGLPAALEDEAAPKSPTPAPKAP
jgi:preprotein translocase subunit SecG